MEDESDGADGMIEAVGIVLQELTVALVASGTLDRAEAVKAYLRAEVTADLRDAAERPLSRPRAGYVRLLQAAVEPRLGAKPDFHVLRQNRVRWRQAGAQGPDPWETRRPTPDAS